MEVESLSTENKLENLLARLYFIVPLFVLISIPIADFFVAGLIDISLPNILIILASAMCLVSWTMRIDSEVTNLMPIVIAALAATALTLLMISSSPTLHLHAAAAMMIIILWLTSSATIPFKVLLVFTVVLLSVVSMLLINVSLSAADQVILGTLFISGVVMGGFTQAYRMLHRPEPNFDNLLVAEDSDLDYDEDDDEFFEAGQSVEIDQNWPVVLQHLSKSLNSIYDVDVLFNKMLVVLHEAISFDSAAVGMMQGSELKRTHTFGNEDLLNTEILNWNAEKIQLMAEKRQETTGRQHADLNNKTIELFRLDLPILSNDKLVGLVTLLREAGPFENYACKLSSSVVFHSMLALKNARLHEEVKKLKSKGKQTTLITRDQFMDNAAQRLLKLNQPRSATILIIEIDNFTTLEERYGREVGLVVYTAISELLLAATSDSDILGRYGREGYIVLLNDMDLLDAKQQAERLRQLIEKTPCKTAIGKVTTTVSIGLAAASHSDEDIKSLAHRASMALYVAKESGKNTVKVKL